MTKKIVIDSKESREAMKAFTQIPELLATLRSIRPEVLSTISLEDILDVLQETIESIRFIRKEVDHKVVRQTNQFVEPDPENWKYGGLRTYVVPSKSIPLLPEEMHFYNVTLNTIVMLKRYAISSEKRKLAGVEREIVRKTLQNRNSITEDLFFALNRQTGQMDQVSASRSKVLSKQIDARARQAAKRRKSVHYYRRNFRRQKNLRKSHHD